MGVENQTSAFVDHVVVAAVVLNGSGAENQAKVSSANCWTMMRLEAENCQTVVVVVKEGTWTVGSFVRNLAYAFGPSESWNLHHCDHH